MPFQLPADKSVNFGPETLLERATLAARIGQIANAWNIFEHHFAHTYAFLAAKQEGGVPRPATAIFNSRPALQVFETLDSFRSKHDLFVLSLRATVDGKAPTIIEFYESSVAPRIEIARQARNKVVRAVWGNCHDYPDGIVFKPLLGQSEVYLEGDLKDELVKIVEASDAFEALRSKLFAFFG